MINNYRNILRLLHALFLRIAVLLFVRLTLTVDLVFFIIILAVRLFKVLYLFAVLQAP